MKVIGKCFNISFSRTLIKRRVRTLHNLSAESLLSKRLIDTEYRKIFLGEEQFSCFKEQRIGLDVDRYAADPTMSNFGYFRK